MKFSNKKEKKKLIKKCKIKISIVLMIRTKSQKKYLKIISRNLRENSRKFKIKQISYKLNMRKITREKIIE